MSVYDIHLQQQDHYKVLGLEKLRHKATLGDIKKACKFVILGCNTFNQIFNVSHTCGHARFFPKEPCVVTQMHEWMNFNCAITLRMWWCKKEIFQLNRTLNFFLSLEVLFPKFTSAFFYAPSFLFQVKLNSISKLASSHSSVGRSLQH